MDDHTDLSVCTDCIMLIANGDASGMSENRYEEIVDAWDAQWPAHRFGLGNADEDGDHGFRTSECGACGSGVHGDRFAAHAFPII